MICYILLLAATAALVIGVRFSGPYDKIWSSNQCLNIGETTSGSHRHVYGGSSPSQCKSKCVQTTGCTAINYNSWSCIMKACPFPVPTPQKIVLSTQGYALLTDNSVTQNSSIVPSTTRAEVSAEAPTTRSLTAQPSTSDTFIQDEFVEHDEVWTDSQCGRVGTTWTENLSECMTKCKNTTGCNAIDYKYNRYNVCVHRNCTQPVPTPKWKSILYKGYSLIQDRFVEHDKVWTDNQCGRVGSPWTESLSECMSICKITSGCNAMDYKHDRNDVCVLRACNGSVPLPTWESLSYKGYSLIKESTRVEVPTTKKAPSTWAAAALIRTPTKQKPTYIENTNSESSSSIFIGSITSIVFIVILSGCFVLYLKKIKNKDEDEESFVYQYLTSEQS